MAFSLCFLGCWWRAFRMTAGTVVITGGILATIILLCIIAILCYCRLQVSFCFCGLVSLLEYCHICLTGMNLCFSTFSSLRRVVTCSSFSVAAVRSHVFCKGGDWIEKTGHIMFFTWFVGFCTFDLTLKQLVGAKIDGHTGWPSCIFRHNLIVENNDQIYVLMKFRWNFVQAFSLFAV